MKTIFGRFDKGILLKVHRSTIIYYIIFNCGSLAKYSLILEDLFFIFDLYLWTAYTNASLILEKFFSRSSFYDITCFSTLASGPHLDTTITSENIFTNSGIDAIIFNCGPLIMDASLVLENFFGRSRISPIIKGLNSRSLWSSFGWSTKRNFSEGPALSIGHFQKVQREVSYFPYVVRKRGHT